MKTAVVGSGPAALMAADVLSSQKISVDLFEKRSGIGRKLAIAGSSGLNITNAAPFPDFISYYRDHHEVWRSHFEKFDRTAWLTFLQNLGLKTFVGTSERYFIEDMNAAKLLRLWRERLLAQGVQFRCETEVVGIERRPDAKIVLRFAGQNGQIADAIYDRAIFALGGASYLGTDKASWPALFEPHGIEILPFRPSNAGFQLQWPDLFNREKFFSEALRKPLKNVVVTSSKGSKRGDLLITEYGMEGTPIYFVGACETLTIDLKPDLTFAQMKARCERSKENLSAIRRVKKYLKLDEAALALIFHFSNATEKSDLDLLLKKIKSFPVTFTAAQPLEEAISTSGGISMDEVDPHLMLKKLPGVFVAGEMLDWDAPTGGFLIQGCVTQGFVAAHGAISLGTPVAPFPARGESS